jgi:hypothetical protein
MAINTSNSPAVRIFCTALLCFLTYLASPSANAVYEAIHIDELGLTREQQDRRNKISRALNVKNNLVYITGTVAGFVPEPITSYSGEISAILADIALKHTKASLYAPDDFVARPNANNDCKFEFTLPQSTASYDNILGVWPTLKVVDSLLPDARNARLGLGETVDFGALGSIGSENIRHANAELRLGVFIPDSPNFVELSEAAQTISLPPGTHNIEWRAETLWYPVWDTVIPTVTTALMIGSETKWAKKIKSLKKLKAAKAKSKVINYKNKILGKLRRKPGTNDGRAAKF